MARKIFICILHTFILSLPRHISVYDNVPRFYPSRLFLEIWYQLTHVGVQVERLPSAAKPVARRHPYRVPCVDHEAGMVSQKGWVVVVIVPSSRPLVPACHYGAPGASIAAGEL